jgi:hypothetical protein
VQGTRVLQVGHNIITADRMDQAGALRPDVTTIVADRGDEQVNREHTMGTGHNDVASETQYHNDRQDGSHRGTTTRCNNHSSRLWRREGEPRAYNGRRARGHCKRDMVS